MLLCPSSQALHFVKHGLSFRHSRSCRKGTDSDAPIQLLPGCEGAKNFLAAFGQVPILQRAQISFLTLERKDWSSASGISFLGSPICPKARKGRSVRRRRQELCHSVISQCVQAILLRVRRLLPRDQQYAKDCPRWCGYVFFFSSVRKGPVNVTLVSLLLILRFLLSSTPLLLLLLLFFNSKLCLSVLIFPSPLYILAKQFPWRTSWSRDPTLADHSAPHLY